MELFAKIRRDAARVEGLSIRGLAKRYQCGRETVRQALSDPLPPARKTAVRSSPRLEAFKYAIDVMLTEDTTAPKKQRIPPAGFCPLSTTGDNSYSSSFMISKKRPQHPVRWKGIRRMRLRVLLTTGSHAWRGGT
jgi:hypothetical protein